MFRRKRMALLFFSCVFAIQILTLTVFDLSRVEAALPDKEYEIVSSDSGEGREATCKGDVDGNGEVDSLDFVLMRMYLLGKISSFPAVNGTWAADLNDDGVFNNLDFAIVRKYVLGHIDKFPAETDDMPPAPSTDSKPNPVDTERPSKPKGMIYSSVTGTTVSIYWEPSADIGIKDYAVYKNGEFEALTGGETNYTFANLIPNETYEFKVCAIDAAGKNSKFSEVCVVKTNVGTEEEIKTALVRNFSNRGTTYNLTYDGDMEDIQNKVDRALQDAIYESNEPFMLLDASYSMSGFSGDLKITFTFAYDDEKEYVSVARSFDELEKALLTGFYDRNENMNIIYKGSITGSDLVETVNSVFGKDTYLRFCLYGYSYRIFSMMGINAIECTFDYKTTKEQEDYVDRTVEFIVSKLTSTDMSDDEKEKLIHDFILTYVEYCEDEEHGNAYSALYYGKTKCDGYSMLAYKMLKEAGMESIIVTNEDHAWNLVKVNGKWYHLDTTWNDAGKDYGFYKYYNLSDDEILETRNYTDTNGIDCTTNYIDELTGQNDNSGGKYEEILKEIEVKDEVSLVNKFNGNTYLSLLYDEVVLKEGESIFLVDDGIPFELYENLYQWSTSDPDTATVTNGVVTGIKAGTVMVAAKPMYDMPYDNSLFCRVHVIPAE